MLEVYIDPHSIKSDMYSGINSVKEFVSRWEDIIGWTKSSGKNSIFLESDKLLKLMRNLKDVYGNSIKIVQVSPKEEWEKEYGFKLNDGVSESDIARLIKNKHTLKIKNYYHLETLLLLADEVAFSEEDIEYRLIKALQKGADKKYPSSFTQAIKEFIVILPPGKKELWQFILESDNRKSTVEKMITSAITKGYPQDSPVYNEYFRQSFYYKAFDFDVASTEFLSNSFKRKITKYLESVKDIKITDFISGKLKEELDVILSFLNSNPIQDSDTINKLISKAQEFPVMKTELMRFMPVRPPEKTDVLNFDESYLSWLNDYFKYYKYSRLINKPELTEPYASHFGDSYYFSFSQNNEWLLKNSILSIKEIIESYIKNKRATLLLVIDGLGYEYADILYDVFKVNTKMLFSTPPTKTTENKQRILSGLMDKNISYADILHEQYKDIKWEESNSQLHALSEFLKKKLDLYIYWENQFDRFIHDDMSYNKRFYDHKALIVQKLQETDNFIDEGGAVIITGDHGFSVLPRNDNNCILLPDDINESHKRVAYFDEATIDSKIREKVYFFEKSAIAKGYNYFNSLPRGGTHGGFTPEEVVVPLLIIDKQSRMRVVPLIFKLYERPYYRRQVIETKLIINNLNSFDIVIEDIKITPNICNILEQLPVISPKSEESINITINLQDVNQANVVLNVIYKINAEEYHEQITIKTSGAMIEKELEWD